MGEFWTRAISLVAVIVCLTGYNTVLDKREQAEEKLKEQQAELEQEQSGNAAEEATEVAYKDGTYTGEADGFGGTVKVEVIVKKQKIKEVNIVSADGEDGSYLTMAKDIIPKILDAQSAEVDTISGATFSSTGIKNATKQALEKAVK